MMRAKGPSVAPREMTFLIFSQCSLMATVLKYLKAVSPKDLHSNYLHVIYWALLYKWEHFSEASVNDSRNNILFK